MSFWNQVQPTGSFGPYYLLILFGEVVLAFSLAAVRPAARNRARISIMLLAGSLLGSLLSALITWIALEAHLAGLRSLLNVVAEFCFLIGTILIWAILLFRVILPPVGLQPAPILRDTLLAIAYLSAFLYLLSHHGVNLSGIIATSAVLTGVIGFSLQDTLGNVMGGVSLQLDRSIARGDYIRVGALEGVVRETGWRQTSIETPDWDTVLLPNSVLTKSAVVVLGRAAAWQSPLHRMSVNFAVSLDHNPDDIISTVERALHRHSIANVSNVPAPNCILGQIQNRNGFYTLRYGIHDMLHAGSTNSQIHKRIVGALQRAGISLAAPAQDISILDGDLETAALAPRDLDERLTAITRIYVLESLTDDEKHVVASSLTKARFNAGDIVNYQGEEADYLYILSKGEADVRVIDAGGGTKHVATLGAGDMFGEMGMMTGQPRSATVAAKTDLTCFRLNKDDFGSTLARRPEIAEAISMLLSKRRVELEGVASGGGDQGARAVDMQGEFLTRIKAFFLLK